MYFLFLDQPEDDRSSQYCQIKVMENGFEKITHVKKSTLCWLFSSNACKLSSDRRQRFRNNATTVCGMLPSNQIIHSATNLHPVSLETSTPEVEVEPEAVEPLVVNEDPEEDQTKQPFAEDAHLIIRRSSRPPKPSIKIQNGPSNLKIHSKTKHPVSLDTSTPKVEIEPFAVIRRSSRPTKPSFKKNYM